MIAGLAVPYETYSCFPLKNRPCREIVSTGAFSAVVSSGFGRSGRPIFACWGHRRDGRKDWRIGSTADGRLRLEERPDGVWFELDGIDKLPMDFTGVSVSLTPIRWVKAGFVYRLQEADLRHVALLQWPQKPAYDTFLATVRASMNLGK